MVKVGIIMGSKSDLEAMKDQLIAPRFNRGIQ